MSDAPRRWYRPRLRTLVVLILVIVSLWSVYSYWTDYSERSARREREMLSPGRGARCTVVLRRELLGLDRMAPKPVTLEGITNSVEGRFVLMNDQWIVLDGLAGDEPQHWIPREHVLVLEVQP